LTLYARVCNLDTHPQLPHMDDTFTVNDRVIVTLTVRDTPVTGTILRVIAPPEDLTKHHSIAIVRADDSRILFARPKQLVLVKE